MDIQNFRVEKTQSNPVKYSISWDFTDSDVNADVVQSVALNFPDVLDQLSSSDLAELMGIVAQYLIGVNR